ncbi:MAG: hypothetical protein IJA73_02445 [Oscillospiraceae bacterium]|nr:hypothetical protein [Oscillospiraceae bacterium]
MERYKIAYTDTATNDIAEKFQYIVRVLRDRVTAERWYARLKETLQHDLSFMPEKYPLYAEEPWRSNGVRLFVARQDVVLYSVDKTARIVYILGVCTAGRDLAAHMEDTQVSK